MRRRVILDPGDAFDHLRQLQELHDLFAGRVVVEPRPGITSEVHLAHDVLVAMGKASGPAPRSPAARWRLCRTWIEGERVDHLIVLRAHLLPPALWRVLSRLARQSRVKLWLVYHEPRVRSHHQLALPRTPVIWVERAVSELIRASRGVGRVEPEGLRMPSALSEETAARIRRLCSTHHAAALTLALVGGLDADGLRRVVLSDIRDDGDSLRLGWNGAVVPSYAAGLVRSHVVNRRLGGDEVGLMFLTTTGNGLERYAAGRTLLRAARDAGVDLPPTG